MRFFNLKVKNIIKEAANAVVVEFDIPQNLLANFSYLPGQYLTFKLVINGEEYRRSYSICSTPYQNQNLCIAVKQVTDGVVSTYFNTKLKVGDLLEVMAPNGRFTVDLHQENKKKYIFFAGGSGITPILSIIHSLLIVEPLSTVILYYGNYNENSIIFKDALDELANKYSNFKLFHILEHTIQPLDDVQIGRLTKEKVISLLSKKQEDAVYFICGPTPMMKNVEEALAEFDTPKSQIYVEYFVANIIEEIEEPAEVKKQEIVSQQTITIILDGISTEIQNADSKLPILEMALAAGLDAPYSCQQAVCCSCRAKLITGEVKMKNNYALSEEEISEGFILTCQSIPLSMNTIVNYDL